VFISAEGLFMYFEGDQVMSLITECAARFPGGRLFFDSMPAWFRNRTIRGYRMSARYTAPPMPFALSVSEAARLPARITGVAAVEDLQPPLGRRAWRSRALRKVAALPARVICARRSAC
jgi:O-methyltransferase involved in polyketide biosynthesis